MIHCEIFISDYFMKHNLMHVSLHLIWFNEIYINYKIKKRKPLGTITRKNPSIKFWISFFNLSKTQNAKT